MKKIFRTLLLIRLSFLEYRIRKLQKKREKIIVVICKNAKQVYKLFQKVYTELDINSFNDYIGEDTPIIDFED